MVDRFTPAIRSRIMASVKTRNTVPEIRVRSILHALGLRFRIHRRDLPGTPDIVLPKFRTVVFVNGCFWHRHKGCARATTPLSNSAFWHAKFERNLARDREDRRALRMLGWKAIVVWECELKSEDQLVARIKKVLRDLPPMSKIPH